jgi:hypothetical protein
LVFLAVAVVTAMGAPWMLGSEPVGAQWMLLWGALATLVTGLAARALALVDGVKMAGGWALGASLFFGALLLAQIAVQARNPSHAVVPEGALWRLIPLTPHPWLPQAIAGRFSEGGDYIPFKNAARYALIFGAVWCYAAGLAAGLMRRADTVAWAACLGGNGVVMAGVCLVHRAMREELTLWHYRTTFDFTHSPVFFYKNHNGAYLAASLAIVLGLAASARTRLGQRLWEVGAVLLWFATASVGSRAAAGIATVWLGIYLALRVREWRKTQRTPFGARRVWLGLAATGLAVGAGFFLVKVQEAGALARFGDPGPSAGHPFASLARRALTADLRMHAMQRQVALEMWRDRPVWGWGGGSFVYLFNTYHVRVPELAAQIYRDQPQLHRFYGPTANCDWVEFLVEYGVVGLASMVAAVGFPCVAWLRQRGWRDPLSLCLMLAMAGLVWHGWLDYILRNPALLLLGTGALFAACRRCRPCADD